MQKIYDKLHHQQHLTYEEMTQLAQLLFNEETPEEVIEKLLLALAAKGETAHEIAALVAVMKSYANKIPHLEEVDYIDNCGTGGDGLKSFNISTASAFVLAAAGLKVAKHGNRKVSSSSGSTDILEELGIMSTQSVEELSDSLKKDNIAFIFAPTIHPKLKRIGKIRAKIAKPTIFNLVGPLANPIDLAYQLTGINRPEFLMDYATVMQKIGRKRAVVVSGEQGMDEASLAGVNHCVLMDGQELIPFTITAQDVGLASQPIEAVTGGTPKQNAAILIRILQGHRDAYFDTVAFNAGLALFAANKVSTVQQGVKLAIDTLLSGKALRKLQAVSTTMKMEVL
ncbi:anthranilate phosphoribosyltransferase [Kurthia sibirica]|uniref:Anthranilate phosphoribosyltransferase n=1 Tax=Kurthia sibirica TaxID=202750 RepID=A0A2U3AN41_9BACL|nr:anthranilate phosphoribosyltransferase [Kurthia sibirica]PWI25963.1 anthranilate phosphoribosyltransferase [Kurthia sibirica]GEK35005.1 anthranilate phosphoribosyltransferase [Kurthia sibirica]